MLPLVTTTITVLRKRATVAAPAGPVAVLDPYGEGYDTDTDATPGSTPQGSTWAPVARGVRAHLSAPSGLEQIVGGSQAAVTWKLACEDTDLRHVDRVKDEADGTIYEVSWVAQRTGLGLSHVSAGLRLVTGHA